MKNHSLESICNLSSNKKEDSFVGFKIEKGKPKIFFPIGYDIDNITCQEVHNFLEAIVKYKDKEGNFKEINDSYSSNDDFPYYSYKWIIQDFIEHGYYLENENIYNTAKKGKINWGRTIKKIIPIFSKENDEAIYLNYVVKKTRINETSVLTQIHQFCVCESFQKIGWLYSNIEVNKSNIDIDDRNKNYYVKILVSELKNTFNDYKKELITNMMNIVNGIDIRKLNSEEFEYGTDKFHTIWEKLIDHAFGDDGKVNAEFQPKGIWNLINNEPKTSSSLRPDSVKIIDDKAYIFDAKYYTYSLNGDINKLPSTESIQKQITYGEYIAKSFNTVYNCFILPANMHRFAVANSEDTNYQYIGYAFGEWNDKMKMKEYHYIRTFLIDTKFLINNYKVINSESNYIIEKLNRLGTIE